MTNRNRFTLIVVLLLALIVLALGPVAAQEVTEEAPPVEEPAEPPVVEEPETEVLETALSRYEVIFVGLGALTLIAFTFAGGVFVLVLRYAHQSTPPWMQGALETILRGGLNQLAVIAEGTPTQIDDAMVVEIRKQVEEALKRAKEPPPEPIIGQVG